MLAHVSKIIEKGKRLEYHVQKTHEQNMGYESHDSAMNYSKINENYYLHD